MSGPGGEGARVITNALHGPVFYAVMSGVFLALFVLNVCTHGTMLGLISTGGLALLTGYVAYRTWSATRRADQPDAH